MIFIKNSEEEIRVLEFQGGFENIELFEGHFDPTTLIMNFKDFTMQGKIVKKNFTVFEKTGNEFKKIKEVENVVFFGEPPRFKVNK